MIFISFLIFSIIWKSSSLELTENEESSLFETNKQTVSSLIKSQHSSSQTINIRDFFKFLYGSMHKRKMPNLIKLFEDFLLKYPHGKQEEILPRKVSVNFISYLQFYLKNILSVNYLKLDWSSVENILKLLNKIESFKEDSRDFLNANALNNIMVKNIRLISNGQLDFYPSKIRRKSNLKYENNKNQLQNQTEIVLV
jgi:hypothetical protein